jgi:exodeoxyribonuclease V alpha subunit
MLFEQVSSTSTPTSPQDGSLPQLTPPEMVKYLSSDLFHGIGPRTAQILVDRFGEDTLMVLEYSSARLYSETGLRSHQVNRIIKAWEESRSNPVREAIAWLLGMGVSFNFAHTLTNHYGYKTESALKSDPYRIIEEMIGIGFKTADALARLMGVPPDSPERYRQGVIHALKQTLRSDGHCFLGLEALLDSAIALLSLPEAPLSPGDLVPTVRDAVERKLLIECDTGAIYLAPVYRAELNVATTLKEATMGNLYPTPQMEYWLQSRRRHDEEQNYAEFQELAPLSEEQTRALLRIWANPFSLLTGGPGRGKTHILKYLVEWLSLRGVRFALAAPTGKAAAKMSQVANHEAFTIHRLLQWQGTEQAFTHNANNPVQIDWLIVDEFSMVDLFLFNSLLKALLPTTRVLLVGDFNQLPSVGPGTVLRDLVLSEQIPTSQLTTIYRQRSESPIIYAADDVLMGKTPQLTSFKRPADWANVGDCAMLMTPTPEATALAIACLVTQMKTDGVDLNQYVMVLAPQKQGPAGVAALNIILQPIFNPPRQGEPEVVTPDAVYRIGDRVIQRCNRYDTTPAVMNGEGGWVIDVALKPEKPATVTVEFEGGAIVTYLEGGEIETQVSHAYAITCHKAQGSEFPYVIMPLLLANRRMLTRQLLYTTLTRAAGMFIAVGQPQALAAAVASDRPSRRYTQLSPMLAKAQAELQSEVTRLTYSPTASPPCSPKLVSIAARLRERELTCSKGETTSIGALALQLYQDKFGHRPAKQPERLDGIDWLVRTYHYERAALDLIDQAIDLVIQSPPSDLFG